MGRTGSNTMLKKLFLIAVFMLVCAIPAFAVDVTVTTFTIPNWRYGGTTAKLRLYASALWTDSAGVPHLGGLSGSNTGFYQEVNLTISGSTVTVPQFTTQSTLDSLDVPTVKITAILFDNRGVRHDTLFANWVVPASPTTTTWPILRIYNMGNTIANPPTVYLTRDQTLSLILSSTHGLQDPGSNGLVVRTSENLTTARSIAVGSNLSVSNGDGVSGNPTVSLGTAVPTSVNNDTNVTGSITSNSLTLGWSGTLAAARLNSAVVQAVTNDTNVTGSISAQTLTLSWTGALAKARQHASTVYIDAANAWGDGVKQTFNPDATNAGINIGSQAGDPSSPANGDMWYNSVSGKYRCREGGVTTNCIGITTAGGSTTQVQYNNAGTLGGITGATTDGSTLTLTGPIIANASALPTAALGKLAVDTDDLKLYYAKDGSTWGEVFVAGLSAVNLASANVTGVLPIANGGTNGATATAGFNNLDPLTTKGDVISHDGTNSVRLGVGSNTQVLTADSTQSSGLKWATPAAGTVTFADPGLRLSVETGVSVSTTDQTAKGTLYYTPHKSGSLVYYTGSAWAQATISEINLALTVTSGKNYDVFVACSNSTTCTLSLSSAWTNDTTRADALGTQDGVKALNSDKTKLWIGTIRASGSNVTEDSAGGTTTQVGGKRFVWNTFNQVPRSIAVIDTTDSWSYTTDTWRQQNGASGNKVEYVTGDTATPVDARSTQGVAMSLNVGGTAKVGIGVDSTSTPTGFRQVGYNANASLMVGPLNAAYRGTPGLGYHFVVPLEKGATDGTCEFEGDNGANGTQTGMSVTIVN